MPVFTDGFENNFAPWTGIVADPVSGTPSIVSSPVHHGVKAMSNWLAAVNYAYKTLDADYPHLFVRLYLQVNGLQDAVGRYFKVITLRDASGAVRAQVGLAASGSGVYQWELWVEGVLMQYTDAVVPNHWYCIEIEFDSTTGIHRLYRDGELIITNTTASTAAIREVDVGATEINYWYASAYFDCVAVSETYNGPEVGPTLVTYSSSPITVPATIDGQIVPSGGKIEVPLNSTITVIVPQEVTA